MAIQKVKFWNTKNDKVIYHIVFDIDEDYWCIHDLCEAWLLHQMECAIHELRCEPPLGYTAITVVDEAGVLIHDITES